LPLGGCAQCMRRNGRLIHHFADCTSCPAISKIESLGDGFDLFFHALLFPTPPIQAMLVYTNRRLVFRSRPPRMPSFAGVAALACPSRPALPSSIIALCQMGNRSASPLPSIDTAGDQIGLRIVASPSGSRWPPVLGAGSPPTPVLLLRGISLSRANRSPFEPSVLPRSKCLRQCFVDDLQGGFRQSLASVGWCGHSWRLFNSLRLLLLPWKCQTCRLAHRWLRTPTRFERFGSKFLASEQDELLVGLGVSLAFCSNSRPERLYPCCSLPYRCPGSSPTPSLSGRIGDGQFVLGRAGISVSQHERNQREDHCDGDERRAGCQALHGDSRLLMACVLSQLDVIARQIGGRAEKRRELILSRDSVTAT